MIITTINDLLDATARGEITLDEAESWVRANRLESALQRFEVWAWPSHADLATINETVLWPLARRVKPAPARRATYNAERHAFTCRRCGERRDTTFRGHCDDCEA